MSRIARLSSFLLVPGVLLMTATNLSANTPGSSPNDALPITDFTTATADLGWFVVNDNVMGGRSSGDFDVADDGLHFAGRTNTNGGGFSSIRTKPMRLDLSDYAGIRLHVRGDGRRYTWRLTTDARWRGRPVGYWAEFDTRDGEWSTVDVPFSSFVPQFRGYRLDGPPLDTTKISGMGLMIYDKKDGAFDLQLDSVRAYPARDPVTLDQYRWNNRVLVISAPTGEDGSLNRQQNDVASSAADFAERDMVLVTLLDSGTSRAGDHELTANEADALRAASGINAGSFAVRLVGKDGTVKLSSETVTPMREIYDLIDTMPMRRQEIAGRD